MRSALAVMFLLLTAAPAGAATTVTADPTTLANAIAEDPGVVKSAALPVRADPIAVSTGVGQTFGTAISARGTAGFAILSTGDPRVKGEPGWNDDQQYGTNARGAHDVTVLRLNLDVPADANCMGLDFDFLTNDLNPANSNQPNSDNSLYADGFLAELDPTSVWSVVDRTTTAPANFAVDGQGNVVSYLRASSGNGYNGATVIANSGNSGFYGALGWATAVTPVTPGAHTLDLSTFDRKDADIASAALVDNLRFSHRADGTCARGITTNGDFASPRPTITAPSAGSTTDATTSIAGTSSDDGPLTVNVYSGGAPTGSPARSLPASASSSAWSVDASSLGPGTYTATATQTDGTGNIGVSQPVTFTIAAPALAPSGPGSGEGGKPGGVTPGGSTPPPTNPPAAAGKLIAPTTLQVNAGSVSFKFTCEALSTCTTVVQIIFGKTTSIGTAKASVKPGKTGALKVKLTSAGKKQLKKHKKVKVTLKATVTASGNKTKVTKQATLSG